MDMWTSDRMTPSPCPGHWNFPQSSCSPLHTSSLLHAPHRSSLNPACCSVSLFRLAQSSAPRVHPALTMPGHWEYWKRESDLPPSPTLLPVLAKKGEEVLASWLPSNCVWGFFSPLVTGSSGQQGIQGQKGQKGNHSILLNLGFRGNSVLENCRRKGERVQFSEKFLSLGRANRLVPWLSLSLAESHNTAS